MAIAFTNRGKFRMQKAFFQGAIEPNGFAIVLVDGSLIPTVNTNTMNELQEIIGGNGYTTGGILIPKSIIGFPTSTEDDTLDKSFVVMKNIEFTAVGGLLPSSGAGIRFAVLTDDSATVSDREVFAFAEFTQDTILAIGRVLSIFGLKFSVKEPT